MCLCMCVLFLSLTQTAYLAGKLASNPSHEWHIKTCQWLLAKKEKAGKGSGEEKVTREKGRRATISQSLFF